jgi:chromate transporter
MRRIDLFLGFFKLGAMAFGGTGPLTRAILVDDRLWLDDEEFASLLGLCQALPGANTCNLAVMLGDRFCGATGAIVALAGLLAAPLAVLVTVASFFAAFAHLPDIRAALFGATAAAAGLAIGTAVKMTMKIRPGFRAAALALAAFFGVAALRAPLALVLALLVPAGFVVVGRGDEE